MTPNDWISIRKIFSEIKQEHRDLATEYLTRAQKTNNPDEKLDYLTKQMQEERALVILANLEIKLTQELD